MISFSGFDDLIIVDIFHGLTDGTGAYEVIRTLLFYYCSLRYNKTLSEEGIRTTNNDIPIEEWECPVIKAVNLPTPKRYEMPPALNPITAANLRTEEFATVYSVLTSESDFMRFNRDNGGSPGAMIALLLSCSISYDFQDGILEELPNINLPWI